MKKNKNYILINFLYCPLFYIVFILYNLFLIVLLVPVFIFFLFNSYLNFELRKRWGIYKFKNKKECLVIASSSGEAKIGYDLFKEKANYIVFNKDGFEFLKRYNIEPFPLVYDSLLLTLIFLKINKIKKIFFIEQEIWPSFIIAAKILKIKIYILNGIIYKRSIKFMRIIKFFYGYLFFMFDIIFVRDIHQRKLFSEFINDDKIEISGNLKFLFKKNELISDYTIKKKIISSFSKPIILFASVHKQEFTFIKSIIDYIYKEYFIIIVPRKINDSLYLKSLFKEKFTVILYSQIENNLSNFDLKNYLIKLLNKNEKYNNIIIIDKIGILKNIYEIAYISYIGGSFINKGGQNFVESLIKYTPALVGDSIENFEELFYLFEGKGVFKIKKSDLIAVLKNDKQIIEMYEYLKDGIEILKTNIVKIQKIKEFINCE